MKIFIKLLIAIAILIIAIFAIRIINSLRYPMPDFGTTKLLEDSAYPVSDKHGEISLIDSNRAQGYHMRPKEKTSKGVMLVFGGSEGSSNYDSAYELYADGYEVLSLYFFARKNLPTGLVDIPIEFFRDVEEYMVNENVDTSVITVQGTSKGAELALLLTQYYDIDNLVLYAPSAYSFQGLDMTEESSSWSYGGSPLPYASFSNGSGKAIFDIMSSSILNTPISFLESYSSISKDIKPGDPEWIYVENTAENILVFAGGKDTMWNSADSARALQVYANNVEAHIYPDAGHMFGNLTYVNGMSLGGDKVANLEAKEKSDAILKVRLVEWHQ